MKRRFDTLDGMRGIAALAVASMHIFQLAQPVPTLFPAAAAVDFFFILSGFVLAFAYGERLDRGLPAWEYVAARVIRLYPLIPVGILLDAAIIILRHHQGAPYLPGQSAADVPLALLLVPTGLWQPRPTPNFTFLPPVWSLFFEFAASFLFVTRLRRMSAPLVAALLLVFFVLDINSTIQRTSGVLENGGLLSLTLNLWRIGFAFTLGVVFYRSGIYRRVPRIRFRWLAPVLGIALLMPGVGSAGYALFLVFGLLPLMVLLGANADDGREPHPLCTFLGELSYPLYILHFPLARMTIFAVKHVTPSVPLQIAAGIGVAIVGSMVVWWVYDRPVRRWLGARLRAAATRPVPIPVETAQTAP